MYLVVLKLFPYSVKAVGEAMPRRVTYNISREGQAEDTRDHIRFQIKQRRKLSHGVGCVTCIIGVATFFFGSSGPQ